MRSKQARPQAARTPLARSCPCLGLESKAMDATRSSELGARRAALHAAPPVSYTHLTLPTICSV
eukprot:7893034-Alexandrium_andersonii.AAC.1